MRTKKEITVLGFQYKNWIIISGIEVKIRAYHADIVLHMQVMQWSIQSKIIQSG